MPLEPTSGYVPREALLHSLDSVLERRFAALEAPAGFGKTTVLADFSRRKREQGLVVAWISLDEDDTPSLFGSYLAYAFECAGLDLSVLNDPDAWLSSPATYQIGMLASAIDSHAAPCLLVLDEVDMLPRETVELVQRLVKRGPRNLHTSRWLSGPIPASSWPPLSWKGRGSSSARRSAASRDPRSGSSLRATCRGGS